MLINSDQYYNISVPYIYCLPIYNLKVIYNSSKKVLTRINSFFELGRINSSQVQALSDVTVPVAYLILHLHRLPVLPS
ncbi:hypothetical protein C2G38_2122163 [Gigaspora rosea]|uniref:Uncharacterized protein n=1 Tax=Gigaspora rosea TaxID=44941 RepID=A0A397U480_9GLOM|nr:hypothetical protein C2G38_2122163 [Gigaspora rosea]